MGKALESEFLRGVFLVQWLEYPVGNRAYGGGGWSSRAKHRPAPEAFQEVVDSIEIRGRSAVVCGTRKLKLNIYDMKNRKWLRTDYPDMRDSFEMLKKASDLMGAARISGIRLEIACDRRFEFDNEEGE
jgi:hypothetical protein